MRMPPPTSVQGVWGVFVFILQTASDPVLPESRHQLYHDHDVTSLAHLCDVILMNEKAGHDVIMLFFQSAQFTIKKKFHT